MDAIFNTFYTKVDSNADLTVKEKETLKQSYIGTYAALFGGSTPLERAKVQTEFTRASIAGKSVPGKIYAGVMHLTLGLGGSALLNGLTWGPYQGWELAEKAINKISGLEKGEEKNGLQKAAYVITGFVLGLLGMIAGAIGGLFTQIYSFSAFFGNDEEQSKINDSNNTNSRGPTAEHPSIQDGESSVNFVDYE